MSLRIDEEEYENRDFGLKLRDDRRRSSDELFYERYLGTPIGMLDYNGSEENVEKHCKKLNKQEVAVEFRPFKVADGNFKIVKVLFPPRKINYGRLKSLLENQLKKYIDHSIQVERNEIPSGFSPFIENLRHIQRLLISSDVKEDVATILLNNISEAEVNLILYLQPKDEKEILQDVENYYKFKEIEEKATPISKEVVAKSKFRSPRNEGSHSLPF